MNAALPPGEITRAALSNAPDDGHRYELLDGALVVSPSPTPRHQYAVGELFVILREAAPADLVVFAAPLDVVLASDTIIQPDVVVARRAELTDRELPAAPVLAVEVLSPSTRGVDLLLKRDRLQRAGCQHYWIVDLSAPIPEITALVLEGGTYREAAVAAGAEVLNVVEPFPVTFAPADLAL